MSYVEKPGQVTLTQPGEQVTNPNLVAPPSIVTPPAPPGTIPSTATGVTPIVPNAAPITALPGGPSGTLVPGAIGGTGALAPPPTPPTPGTGTGSADLSGTQQDAWAILQQTLQQYGFSGQDLTDLTNFVKNELIAGTGSAQIQLDLENTQQFARRFPAIIARRNAGLTPITPSTYVSLEQSYEQLEHAAGLTPQMFDSEHYDSLIAADVSPTEYSTRINQGYVASQQAPQDVKDALYNFYGVSPGDLTAFWLDPAKSLPILQQRFAAAQIGGAANRTGFGGVNVDQAQLLAQLGITPDAAQTGFTALAKQSQLTSQLPGQSQQALGADDLLAAQFEGNAATQAELVRRAGQQEADFKANTAFGQTATGVTGLGPVVK